MMNRRQFGKLSLAGLAALAGPRRVLASPALDERKFLVIYANGGWDYSYVFAPLFDNEWVSVDESSTEAELNGITFVDAESRPSVRSFFGDYGDRTCILNGIEVRSITHQRCQRLAFTGTTSTQADDFSSILAAHSKADLLLPHTVISGPAYTSRYTSQVVRVGQSQQLPVLLEGEHPEYSTHPIEAQSASVESAVDAFVRERAQAYADLAGPGRAQRFGLAYDLVLEQLAEVSGLTEDMDFSSGDVHMQATNAINLLELGVTRCATVKHNGLYELGWDTHATNTLQDSHFELLFELLNSIMVELDSRTSLSGNPLSDEVTVVVLSEMGRDPRMNAQNGKHHWTFTSAMMVGSGVAGGRVIGAFDEHVTGSPIDLVSGELSSSGVPIYHSHLGATMLALGDVDPGEYLNNTDPILAAMS
jgi:hypothetical protein